MTFEKIRGSQISGRKWPRAGCIESMETGYKSPEFSEFTEVFKFH